MMKKILSYALTVCFSQAVCFAQNDSLYQRDSVVETGENCTQDFFIASERISDPSKIFIRAKNGTTTSMKTFLVRNNIGGFSESGLADLDGDGVKELIISNFTGGAHCCDEIYLFRQTAPGRFRYVARTFAGHTCFLDDNTMRFSFYESFGYFFTCYACTYTDTSETAPLPVSSVILKYGKGKLSVVPGDPVLRSLIRDNLDKLSEQPYEEMDEISQDNGLRKEFALNLAVFYYSFGRNMSETQRLFNTYYKFPDKKAVWKEFYRLLLNVRQKNDF